MGSLSATTAAKTRCAVPFSGFRVRRWLRAEQKGHQHVRVNQTPPQKTPRPGLSLALVARPDEERQEEQPRQAHLLQLSTRAPRIEDGGIAQPENRPRQ